MGKNCKKKTCCLSKNVHNFLMNCLQAMLACLWLFPCLFTSSRYSHPYQDKILVSIKFRYILVFKYYYSRAQQSSNFLGAQISYRVYQKSATKVVWLMSPATNMLDGWDISHLKGGIRSSVWSTKTFLHNIREPRFLAMNILEGGDTSLLQYASGITPFSIQHMGTEI